MARGPGTFKDRKRMEQIQQRWRMLKDERTCRVDGSEHPTREQLKAAAEKLVYEDLEWLFTRIERNWD